MSTILKRRQIKSRIKPRASIRRKAEEEVLDEAEEIIEEQEKNSEAVIIGGDLDASKYEDIAMQILELEESDAEKIVLEINSCGGDVVGIDTALQVLKDCKKPIETLITGVCASSAYWLASQSDKIVAMGENVLVGSIGVFASMLEDSNYLDAMGISKWQVVSKGSPKKLAQTEEDFVQQEQPIVDEILNNFVEDVASGRGLTVDEVLSNFGEGAILTASKAMEVGMIDAVLGASEEEVEEEIEDVISESEGMQARVQELSRSIFDKSPFCSKQNLLRQFRRRKMAKMARISAGLVLPNRWKNDCYLGKVSYMPEIKSASFYESFKRRLDAVGGRKADGESTRL